MEQPAISSYGDFIFGCFCVKDPGRGDHPCYGETEGGMCLRRKKCLFIIYYICVY